MSSNNRMEQYQFFSLAGRVAIGLGLVTLVVSTILLNSPTLELIPCAAMVVIGIGAIVWRYAERKLPQQPTYPEGTRVEWYSDGDSELVYDPDYEEQEQ